MRTAREFLIDSLRSEEAAVHFLEVSLEEFNEDRDLVLLADSILLVAEAQGKMVELGLGGESAESLAAKAGYPPFERLFLAFGLKTEASVRFERLAS